MAAIEPGTWCLVELMGHRTEIGQLFMADIAGAQFLHIVCPDGRERFYRPDSVYGITPSTEEELRERYRFQFERTAALPPSPDDIPDALVIDDDDFEPWRSDMLSDFTESDDERDG